MPGTHPISGTPRIGSHAPSRPGPRAPALAPNPARIGYFV